MTEPEEKRRARALRIQVLTTELLAESHGAATWAVAHPAARSFQRAVDNRRGVIVGDLLRLHHDAEVRAAIDETSGATASDAEAALTKAWDTFARMSSTAALARWARQQTPSAFRVGAAPAEREEWWRRSGRTLPYGYLLLYAEHRWQVLEQTWTTQSSEALYRLLRMLFACGGSISAAPPFVTTLVPPSMLACMRRAHRTMLADVGMSARFVAHGEIVARKYHGPHRNSGAPVTRDEIDGATRWYTPGHDASGGTDPGGQLASLWRSATTAHLLARIAARGPDERPLPLQLDGAPSLTTLTSMLPPTMRTALHSFTQVGGDQQRLDQLRLEAAKESEKFSRYGTRSTSPADTRYPESCWVALVGCISVMTASASSFGASTAAERPLLVRSYAGHGITSYDIRLDGVNIEARSPKYLRVDATVVGNLAGAPQGWYQHDYYRINDIHRSSTTQELADKLIEGVFGPDLRGRLSRMLEQLTQTTPPRLTADALSRIRDLGGNPWIIARHLLLPEGPGVAGLEIPDDAYAELRRLLQPSPMMLLAGLFLDRGVAATTFADGRYAASRRDVLRSALGRALIALPVNRQLQALIQYTFCDTLPVQSATGSWLNAALPTPESIADMAPHIPLDTHSVNAYLSGGPPWTLNRDRLLDDNGELANLVREAVRSSDEFRRLLGTYFDETLEIRGPVSTTPATAVSHQEGFDLGLAPPDRVATNHAGGANVRLAHRYRWIAPLGAAGAPDAAGVPSSVLPPVAPVLLYVVIAYAHLQSIPDTVQETQVGTLREGSPRVIGRTGMSGNTVSPHLHLDISMQDAPGRSPTIAHLSPFDFFVQEPVPSAVIK